MEATIDLNHPYRSRFYRMVNSLNRRKEIDLSKIKFHQHLDPKTRESGEFLLTCLNETADLNGFGKWMVNNFFKEVFKNHYQVGERLQGETFAPIRNPIIILGLPRTGSTYLFNLLGATDQFRTLRNWETHEVASRKPDFLKKISAVLLLKMQHRIAPGLRTIHEQRLEGPEECSKMLLSCFVSQMFPALFHIPKYNDFLDGADFLPTYQFFHQQLQVLDNHNKRWLLKSPIHTQSIDSLLEVFPNACFVHLHRDFDEVLGSICSLSAAFRALAGDHLDGKLIGSEVKKFLQRDLAKSQTILKANRERVLEVHYKELIGAPVDTVRGIFDFAESGFDAESETRVRKEIEITRPNKFGKHVYRLEDYFPSEP